MDLEKIIAELHADISNFVAGMNTAVSVGKRSMSAIADSAKGFRKELNSLGDKVLNIKSVLAAVGAGAVAKSFVDAASTTEQLKTRLGVLLGSVSEGNALFKDMAKFASSVPFEYENIMGAAAKLSTVMKGGRQEISKFMPMVADVAAAYGMTVEQAADQVARAFSAGAGAADLFRDKGVNAMLGFKAGASVSAEEFKTAFVNAYESANSKFKGASDKLAGTWDGILSMMSDKWFQFRNVIMEAGVWNYIKGLAQLIDTSLGGELDKSKKDAKDWATTIIDGVEVVIKAVGFLKTAWQGIELVWAGLKIAFEGIKLAIVEGLSFIADKAGGVFEYMIKGINKVREIAGMEPIDLDIGTNKKALDMMKQDTLDAIAEMKENFKNLVPEKTGLQEADEWITKIRANAAKLKEETEKAAKAPPPPPAPEAAAPVDKKAQKAEDTRMRKLEEQHEALKQSLMSETELEQQAYEDRKELARQYHEDYSTSESEYYDEIRALAMDHQKKMGAINKKKYDADMSLDKQRWQQGISAANNFFGSMMSLTQGKNKQLFELSKKGAIATTIIETYKSAQSAFSSMASIPYVGPILGAAAAAAAVAAGIARVNAIRSTSFDGGGGAGAAGGGGVSASGAGATPGGVGGASQPEFGPTVAAKQNVTVNLGDDDGLISKRTVRKLIEGINDQLKDGAQIASINTG